MNSVGKQIQVNMVGNEMVDDIHGSVTGYSTESTFFVLHNKRLFFSAAATLV